MYVPVAERVAKLRWIEIQLEVCTLYARLRVDGSVHERLHLQCAQRSLILRLEIVSIMRPETSLYSFQHCLILQI